MTEQEKTRRAISRAAVLLAASKSENVKNQAFRLLVQKFQFSARHDELEAELAQLHADSLRELAQLLPAKVA